jgi:hypothetical protein
VAVALAAIAFNNFDIPSAKLLAELGSSWRSAR